MANGQQNFVPGLNNLHEWSALVITKSTINTTAPTIDGT
jgi:hypothetical protein